MTRVPNNYAAVLLLPSSQRVPIQPCLHKHSVGDKQVAVNLEHGQFAEIIFWVTMETTKRHHKTYRVWPWKRPWNSPCGHDRLRLVAVYGVYNGKDTRTSCHIVIYRLAYWSTKRPNALSQTGLDSPAHPSPKLRFLPFNREYFRGGHVLPKHYMRAISTFLVWNVSTRVLLLITSLEPTFLHPSLQLKQINRG